MSNIVIVSSHCYLLCEAVEHISIDVCGDRYDDDDEIELVKRISRSRRKPKKPTKRQKQEAARKEEAYYQVSISFIAVNRNSMSKNGGSSDHRTLQITLKGHEKAMGLYKEIVSQIREQIPDQLFLNDLVTKLLEG